MLSTLLDSLSSTKVRKRMVAGHNLAPVTGEAVSHYMTEHEIQAKVAGHTAWTEWDRQPLQLLAPVEPFQAIAEARTRPRHSSQQAPDATIKTSQLDSSQRGTSLQIRVPPTTVQSSPALGNGAAASAVSSAQTLGSPGHDKRSARAAVSDRFRTSASFGRMGNTSQPTRRAARSIRSAGIALSSPHVSRPSPSSSFLSGRSTSRASVSAYHQ